MLAGVPPSAGQCRFVRVISVLIFPGAPELCWFCVAQERTGHPRSQRSAEQAFTLDAGQVTVASALGQLSICAYLLLARTYRQPVIDGRSQSVTHGMGVREQITARNDAEYGRLKPEYEVLAEMRRFPSSERGIAGGQPTYPAQFSSVISVAAHDGRDPFALDANPAPPTDFGAPGIDVAVPWLAGATIVATGNSFAASHVTGLVARLLSKHRI